MSSVIRMDTFKYVLDSLRDRILSFPDLSPLSTNQSARCRHVSSSTNRTPRYCCAVPGSPGGGEAREEKHFGELEKTKLTNAMCK